MIISKFARNVLFVRNVHAWRALAQIKSQGLRSGGSVVSARRMRVAKSKWGTKRSTIRWLQSQEQKLLRARSGSVIRMLMRVAIGRGHPEPRGETHESPVALLKRGGAFFDGRAHVHARMYVYARVSSAVAVMNKWWKISQKILYIYIYYLSARKLIITMVRKKTATIITIEKNIWQMGRIYLARYHSRIALRILLGKPLLC